MENDVKLNEEIKNFADFIIGDFEDSYDNLKYKTFMGYQYVKGEIFNGFS
jgi:hypothetical protein